MRSECPTLKMEDDEIEEMFGIIDGDGGGTISGQEFYEGLAECASPCLPISRATATCCQH